MIALLVAFVFLFLAVVTIRDSTVVIISTVHSLASTSNSTNHLPTANLLRFVLKSAVALVSLLLTLL